jgi:uncharacterized metal-binding protein (TIGR02443 family)
MARRFIAGAVCPRCGLMDKLRLDSETRERDCVSCGFSDSLPASPVTEPATRVNRPAARLVETRVESVRLVENSPGSTDSSDQEGVD